MILIVEDNPLTAEWFGDIFRSVDVGYQIVGDGIAAVELAATHDYDALLVDWRIPGQSGVAAATQIRALPPPRGKVPIVLITGGMTTDDLDLLGGAGFNAVMQKPFRADDLIELVRRLTRKDEA